MNIIVIAEDNNFYYNLPKLILELKNYITFTWSIIYVTL